ncbi:MAG TPA: hypothetical protein DCS93_29620 [Microscillaceae bacterium]|nr:hypothetical protein [Microscillaceae bacterium]
MKTFHTRIFQVLFTFAWLAMLTSCRTVTPTIAYLKAPKIVKSGDPMTLSWKVNNLGKHKIRIRGDRSKEKYSARSKKVYWPKRTRTFHLYIKNRKNKTVARKTVKTQVVNASFTGPLKVLAGDPARLSWRVLVPARNIQLAEIVNGHLVVLKERLPKVGYFDVRPTQATTYQLLIENQGVVHFDHHLEVKEAFFIGSRVVTPQADAILQWRVNPKASQVWVEQKIENRYEKLQGNLPLDGRMVLQPKYEQNYYRLVVLRDGQKQYFPHEVRIKVARPYIRNLQPIAKMKPGVKMSLEIFAYDRSNYPKEIKFQVMAYDPKGNFVTGLAPDLTTAKKYFLGLAEEIEGERFPINDFKVTEVNRRISKPYSIATVLDYSGSMWGVTPNLETAIKEFIKRKNPNDEISVIKFDDQLVRKVQRARHANDIIKKSAFDGESGGATALYAGADEGIKTIERSKHQRVVVLFTDGQENSSFTFSDSHAFTAKQLVKRARETNTRLFTVCFGGGANRNLLEAVALLTDGRNYFLEDESEITQVYQELPYIFKNYYEVSYRPTQKDGPHLTLLTYNNLETVDTTSSTTFIGDDFDPNMYEDFARKVIYRPEGKILKSAQGNTTVGKLPKPTQVPRVIDVKAAKQNQPLIPPQAVAFFKHNHSKIDQKYYKNLEVYVRYLQKNKKARMHILGHSDLKGTMKGCQRISEERANAVKQFFLERGINTARMRIQALGRTRPVWAEEKKEVHGRDNRRVEIILIE